MRVSGERTYLLKCIDRLVGLAESHTLPLKGYSLVKSGDKSYACVAFAFGTDMEVVQRFCRDAQKCFRRLILSVGTTGPDSKSSAYPTIFITHDTRRIRHIGR